MRRAEAFPVVSMDVIIRPEKLLGLHPIDIDRGWSYRCGGNHNQSTIMSSAKKSMLVSLLAAMLFALITTGCNTSKGFGKDVEKVGEKIQDKASR